MYSDAEEAKSQSQGKARGAQAGWKAALRDKNQTEPLTNPALGSWEPLSHNP